MERASLSFYAIFVYIPALATPTLLPHIELLPIFQNPCGCTFSEIGLAPHAKPRITSGRGEGGNACFRAPLGSGSTRRPPAEWLFPVPSVTPPPSPHVPPLLPGPRRCPWRLLPVLPQPFVSRPADGGGPLTPLVFIAFSTRGCTQWNPIKRLRPIVMKPTNPTPPSHLPADWPQDGGFGEGGGGGVPSSLLQ